MLILTRRTGETIVIETPSGEVVEVTVLGNNGQVETAKSRHADELYQVLRDLTSMAKLGVPISCINTYLAAIRNAEQLLEKIDEELEKDSDHDQQA